VKKVNLVEGEQGDRTSRTGLGIMGKFTARRPGQGGWPKRKNLDLILKPQGAQEREPEC
jgi:hypothetical protein